MWDNRGRIATSLQQDVTPAGDVHGLCVFGESVEVVDDFPGVVIDGAMLRTISSTPSPARHASQRVGDGFGVPPLIYPVVEAVDVGRHLVVLSGQKWPTVKRR